MKRKGILAFGNWIVDYIKDIDSYPDKNLLAIISNQKMSIGGGPANISVDLSKMEVDFPIYAGGVIGDDSSGEYILKTLSDNKIVPKYMRKTKEITTAYTDVMNGFKDSTRTFFHFAGSNSLLSYRDFENVNTNAKICYIGYLLLLRGLEKKDEQYGSSAAKSLAFLQKKGFMTVVDLVSNKEADINFIRNCLKYIDYLIINEIEAEIITCDNIRNQDETININNLKSAINKIIGLGVNEQVIIHFPEGALAIDKNGSLKFEPSYYIDAKEIIGSVGAGDAFCAGVLYGIHENLCLNEILKIGNANAWFNLHSQSATEGAVSINEIRKFIKTAKQNKSLFC
ncbi:MAG: carbohydrate kinase family protein [bacterium]|nr:carbohydrate kinase family protein [bacterium]